MDEAAETVEADEVIVAESISEDERRLRVYDSRGDFVITIPAGAKVTFGYFNPAVAGSAPRGGFAGYSDQTGAGSGTMKTTALRIYEKAEKGNQLACFMGVSGFRDQDAVKMTRLTQKVTIETNFEDDGEGIQDFRRKAAKALHPVDEDTQFQQLEPPAF